MLGVTDLPAYIIGTIAIVLLPGPNSIYVLTAAARRGIPTGYRAAAGVFLGDWVLMIAAAAGVASLLRAYPPLFLVIKYLGAAYLTYLGTAMMAEAWRRWRRPTLASAADLPAAPLVRPFQRAFIISLLNPKAILFFISFFIQFLDPAAPYPALSFLLLAVILQICSAIYLSALILGGTYLAAQFSQRRRLASGLTAGVGLLFLGFGLRLATASLS